jgi:hypothetical protein
VTRAEDTRDHPDAPGVQLAVGRQPADEEGDEDHVVDAQDDLQQAEGKEADQGVKRKKGLHSRSVKSHKNKGWWGMSGMGLQKTTKIPSSFTRF